MYTLKGNETTELNNKITLVFRIDKTTPNWFQLKPRRKCNESRNGLAYKSSRSRLDKQYQLDSLLNSVIEN